jgi:hypothetical protein
MNTTSTERAAKLAKFDYRAWSANWEATTGAAFDAANPVDPSEPFIASVKMSEAERTARIEAADRRDLELATAFAESLPAWVKAELIAAIEARYDAALASKHI